MDVRFYLSIGDSVTADARDLTDRATSGGVPIVTTHAEEPDDDARTTQRVRADGKYLVLAGLPFRVRGVTYGSFRPRSDGELFPEPQRLDQDFASIVAAGFNTVRTYGVPPVDLLESAHVRGLRVIVGLQYEDWRAVDGTGANADRRVRDAGRRAVAAALERCAGHPEVLAISVGNEVPADLIRLHGIRRVERTLSALVEEVHRGDVDILATYSSFPTTEYLRIEGQDLACFNVFLEDSNLLRGYIRRLQVVTPGLPLVITELGLASHVHGEQAQAALLAEQLQVLDEEGCAGGTIFSWTDEWSVAGEDVSGWGFGLTDEKRRPKPALREAAQWCERTVEDLRPSWPSMTVVVCAYNEEKVIEDCLASLRRSFYPDLEVVVVDDGSTDATAAIAEQSSFRLLRLVHGGLSRARNAGISAASGEIVAFLDADAACHPEWPFHLALSLEDAHVVGTGGPNLPFEDVGLAERAVAASPGNPVEVLITDDRAEHVPGCNMAFLRSALLEVEGFDPIFTSAGDDVDLCWKLLDRGHQLGFSAAAQVRHHRRGSCMAYLRQQRGYGRAERMVAARHRHRFNRLGQARWRGAIYGGMLSVPKILRPIVYHGTMGAAPFQNMVNDPNAEMMSWAAAMLPLSLPVACLALVAGALWTPAFVLAGLAVLAILSFGAAAAWGAHPAKNEPRSAVFRALVAALHIAQPFARVWGRLQTRPPVMPPGRPSHWDGDRRRWLDNLVQNLIVGRCSVRVSGPHERWDLRVAMGPFLRAQLTTAVVWSWIPRVNARIRPRCLTWFVLLAEIALVAADTSAGWPLLGLTIACCLAEAAFLRHRIKRAVRLTSEGAQG